MQKGPTSYWEGKTMIIFWFRKSCLFQNDDQLWYRWWSLQLGSLIKFESVLKSDCGSFQCCNLSEHVDHIGFKKYCAITYQSQLIILLDSVQWPYHTILITLITRSNWGPAYIWSCCLTSMKATYQRKLVVILFDMLRGINPLSFILTMYLSNW